MSDLNHDVYGYAYVTRPGFVAAAARNADPQTSKDAAKSMTAPILNRQRRQVLKVVCVCSDGATAYEVDRFLAMQQNVCSRRLTDLNRLGFVEVIGTRPGRSGRLCNVFRITDAGREALR